MKVLSRPAEPTLVLNEVDEHIVTQSFRGGEKSTTLVDLGESLNELPQTAIGIEHEGVDDDSFAGALHDFSQG